MVAPVGILTQPFQHVNPAHKFSKSIRGYRRLYHGASQAFPGLHRAFDATGKSDHGHIVADPADQGASVSPPALRIDVERRRAARACAQLVCRAAWQGSVNLPFEPPLPASCHRGRDRQGGWRRLAKSASVDPLAATRGIAMCAPFGSLTHLAHTTSNRMSKPCRPTLPYWILSSSVRL